MSVARTVALGQGGDTRVSAAGVDRFPAIAYVSLTLDPP
jgi:hypothetical protein